MQPTGDLPTKTCRVCKQTKTVDNFTKLTNRYQLECKSCKRKRESILQETNSDLKKHKQRLKHKAKLKYKFNLTVEQHEELLKKQENLCAICKQPPSGANQYGTYQFCVDHCHETGEVRGLLCGHCNLGLGQFKDNPALLESAKKYLEGEEC